MRPAYLGLTRPSLALAAVVLLAAPLSACGRAPEEWTSEIIGDPLDDQITYFNAVSPRSHPKPRQEPPYDETAGWIVVRCVAGALKDVYIQFTGGIFITDYERAAYGLETQGRFRWNGRGRTPWKFIFDDPNEPVLFFKDPERFVEKQAMNQTLVVEFDIFNIETVTFNFLLAGAVEAIEASRISCINAAHGLDLVDDKAQ